MYVLKRLVVDVLIFGALLFILTTLNGCGRKGDAPDDVPAAPGPQGEPGKSGDKGDKGDKGAPGPDDEEDVNPTPQQIIIIVGGTELTCRPKEGT